MFCGQCGLPLAGPPAHCGLLPGPGASPSAAAALPRRAPVTISIAASFLVRPLTLLTPFLRVVEARNLILRCRGCKLTDYGLHGGVADRPIAAKRWGPIEFQAVIDHSLLGGFTRRPPKRLALLPSTARVSNHRTRAGSETAVAGPKTASPIWRARRAVVVSAPGGNGRSPCYRRAYGPTGAQPFAHLQAEIPRHRSRRVAG